MKIAVVGVGYMGRIHAACVAQAENMELAAIVEPNEALGMEVAKEFGVPYLKSVADLRAHPEIQAVNICVPEEYHCSTAVQCAELGLHIAIEKPIAKTVEEANRMVEACERNHVRLLVLHTVHFLEDYRLMKNQYDDGAIGNVSQITITRDGHCVNAKSLLGFLSLMRDHGEVELSAEGADAGEALETLAKLLETK